MSGGAADAPAHAGARADRVLCCAVILAATAVCIVRLVELHVQAAMYDGFSADVMGACIVGLASVAATLRWADARPKMATGAFGAGLGILFFIYTLGFSLVDPRNINWLLHDDWAQHFIGWHFYRNAPWAWPPGKFDAFWYPVGTSIIYTDSLPLFALPLRLVSAWLPVRFQYIGLWLLISCTLQGMFGALLVRRFLSGLAVQALGGSLLLLAPIFISRIDHDTLTAHWILLAALWLYFDTGIFSRATFVAWLLLAAIAALVHPYLSVMFLAVAAAGCLSAVLERRLSLQKATSLGAAMCGVTLCCWWLAGTFTLHPGGGGVALGIYNSNLLTWIDSQSMSRWLPPLQGAGEQQYDGRGYLGLGAIVLLVLSAALTTRRALPAAPPAADAQARTVLWPLLVVAFATAVFAFSTRFALGDSVILDVTPADAGLLGSFRASGRFIWLSTYLLTLLGFVFVVRRGGRSGVALATVAVALQVFELSPLHERSQHLRETAASAAGLLTDPGWPGLASGRRHITLIPPLACGIEAAPYLPFSLLAADLRMTINTGYVARFDEPKTFAYCEVLRDDIASGKRDADTLYIVGREQLAAFRATSSASMHCREMDGYTACATALP